MGPDHATFLLLGGMLMAASCAAADAPSPLALYEAGPEAQEALLQGRLMREGACLYITGDGGERWLAAFPSPGTTWQAADSAVQVGTRTIRVGETGAFAGGEVPSPAPAIRWVQPPAESCQAAKLWMVSGLMDPAT